MGPQNLTSTPGEFRKLPSIDRLLQQVELQGLAADVGHALIVEAARTTLDQARIEIVSGAPCPSSVELTQQVASIAQKWLQPSIQPVINATGVIIHTNLGRAPLSERARQAMDAVARGYSNLEYDLGLGQRGSRYLHAEAILQKLTGAESALVVNNNAAAVLLMLSALAYGKEVVISRGQMVEIGGGFRIPDVMRQSGARLIEVGTTNRTHVPDYERAIGPDTAALMRVHHSNFKMLGFTQDVTLAEMASVAKNHTSLLFDDLGSGTLLDTARAGLEHEPTVQESLVEGADLVSFSGDKLLGGPQAGIIVGRISLIDILRRHPLTRAVRVDKITLAGLQATLQLYLEGRAWTEIPVWRMMTASVEDLNRRAERWQELLRSRYPAVKVEITRGQSTVGGGSLPGETLPTVLLSLTGLSATALGQQLRRGRPAVVGRIENDQLLVDPRTVAEDEDELLLKALDTALSTLLGDRSSPEQDMRGKT